MKKKLWFCAVALTVVCVAGSTTWAFGYLGPPQTTSAKGQLGIDLGYNHTRNDIRLKDVTWMGTDYAAMSIKSFTSDTVFTNLGYGVTKNLEAYLKLGATNYGEGAGPSTGMHRLSGDTEFIWGWGLRATIHKTPKLAWGANFQMNRINFAGKMQLMDTSGEVPVVARDGVRVTGWEYILSAGPTWNVCDRCSIYGGPFIHYMQGGIKGYPGGSRYSADIGTEAWLGGMIGLQVDLCRASKFFFEYAHSDDIDSVSLGCTYRH